MIRVDSSLYRRWRDVQSEHVHSRYEINCSLHDLLSLPAASFVSNVTTFLQHTCFSQLLSATHRLSNANTSSSGKCGIAPLLYVHNVLALFLHFLRFWPRGFTSEKTKKPPAFAVSCKILCSVTFTQVLIHLTPSILCCFHFLTFWRPIL